MLAVFVVGCVGARMPMVCAAMVKATVPLMEYVTVMMGTLDHRVRCKIALVHQNVEAPHKAHVTPTLGSWQ